MGTEHVLPGDEDTLIAELISSHLATLTEITNSGDAKHAAEDLARLGTPGLATLVRVLSDPAADTEARQWAVLALGSSGDEAIALGPLVAALRDVDGGRFLPLAAAIALGRLGTAAAAEALVEVLADSTYGHYGRAHIDALHEIGTPAVPALLHALAEGSAAQRHWAAYILGWLREPQALQPLVAALGDPDEVLRAAAAGALAWLGDARAAPALLPLLSDPAPSVRAQAANALGSFDRREVVPASALLPLLYDPSPDVRAAAVRTLGHIGDAEAISALKRLRQEDHAEDEERITVSEYAAWALDRITTRLDAARTIKDERTGETA
jgi:HEAT repeat protein